MFPFCVGVNFPLLVPKKKKKKLKKKKKEKNKETRRENIKTTNSASL